MKFIRITFTIIGILIFLIFAIGSIDSEESTTSSNTKEKTKSTDENSKSTEKKESSVYKIGDNIDFDNVTYTVNSSEEYEGSEYNQPSDGNKFYVVNITIENKSTDTVTVSSILMFKLVDSKSYNYDITVNTDAKGQVDGVLQKDEKLRGELTFEVPKSETDFTLDIDPDPSIFGTGQFLVDLTK